ncbi:winged helix-turn-helix domain-containing protein [Chitinophaga japonensis]|uniref:Transcriptional regulator n=1 Tax=Chitinophaga japonensis TaxID=104662 RepID=A0A562T2H4_CHIJA|nr:winged helix-turn-helix domain-containing protein [Chitinophaga japonensis]TWI87792.1 transcriptional regulator [Chitinophaga japonensis]
MDTSLHKMFLHRKSHNLRIAPIKIGAYDIQADGLLFFQGKPLGHFTRIELAIFNALYSRKGKIITANQILNQLEKVDNRRNREGLRGWVCRIRRTLKHIPVLRLDTISGYGYQLIQLDEANNWRYGGAIQYKGLCLDPPLLKKRDGTIVYLSPTYATILSIFFSRPEEHLNWDTIRPMLNANGCYMESNTFKVTLSNIRHLLLTTGIEIYFERKSGYVLRTRRSEEGRQGNGRRRIRSSELLVMCRDIEQIFRKALVESDSGTVRYSAIKDQYYTKVNGKKSSDFNTAFLYVRRKYRAYYVKSHSGVAIVVNKDIPTETYY